MSIDAFRILIAEDDCAIARVLSRNLEREGFIVEVAHTGGDALRAIERGEFHFLLTDYQMPDISGETLCRQIRSNPQHQNMPIALCTAKAHEVDTAALVVELKLAHVFFKPFSLREIVNAIRQTIDVSISSVA